MISLPLLEFLGLLQVCKVWSFLLDMVLATENTVFARTSFPLCCPGIRLHRCDTQKKDKTGKAIWSFQLLL